MFLTKIYLKAYEQVSRSTYFDKGPNIYSLNNITRQGTREGFWDCDFYSAAKAHMSWVMKKTYSAHTEGLRN